MSHVVIIGNGVSGITLARHIRKHSDFKITVISKETKYFYSRTALMYVYMGDMKFEDTQPYENWFWEKNNIELIQDEVLKIDTSQKEIHLVSNNIKYEQLVIASGSASNKFGWPGQDLGGVQGLYNYQDLLSMQRDTEGISKAVVIGGGLIGVEMVEMLLSKNIETTFLVREKYFWNAVLPQEEAIMIETHIRKHHVDLKMEKELEGIYSENSIDNPSVVDNRSGKKVSYIKTKSGEKIECHFVGITVGVHPNISFLKDSEIKTNKGVLINQYFETNIRDVYAIGDCAEFTEPIFGRRPIEQVWYTGKMHGERLALNITKEREKYNPGVWFNSAKFFDIEYQTYGVVNSSLKENEGSFVWKDEKENRLFRVNYIKDSKEVIGFNFFGIRARHEICEEWIVNKKILRFVLENLPLLNFDPEFFKSFEKEVVNQYNETIGTGEDKILKPLIRKGLFSIFKQKNNNSKMEKTS